VAKLIETKMPRSLPVNQIDNSLKDDFLTATIDSRMEHRVAYDHKKPIGLAAYMVAKADPMQIT